MRLEVQCNFRQNFNKPSSYYRRLASLKRFLTVLKGLSHEISDTFKLLTFIFTLMLFMNSRNGDIVCITSRSLATQQNLK